MTPKRGMPSGVSLRKIATYGEEVTLRSTVTATDTTSDWDDQTETETTATVDAMIQVAPGRTNRERTEYGQGVDADYDVFIHRDDIPAAFTIYDYDGAGMTEIERGNGHTYTIVRYAERSHGTVEIEAIRE